MAEANKVKRFGLTRRAWIRTILYSGLAIAGGAGYISSRRPELLRTDVPLTGLPRRFEGLRLGVMSDFHAGARWTRENILEAIHLVNSESPELIVLLGDFIDSGYNHARKNLEEGVYVFDALKGLKAPLGTYGVLGNHDHWTDAALVRKGLSGLPAVILDNQSVPLGNGLAVAGVDDFWEGPSEPFKAIEDLNGQSLVLMLSHNPDVNLQLRGDRRVGLVLSGHTHGGQVRLPFINWAPWVPCSKKYRGATGLIRETAHRWTFITKGVGTILVPVRFACPPDVSILRLRRA